MSDKKPDPLPDNNPSTVDLEAKAEAANLQIGPYKILSEIGEGGMGIVYLAKQESPIRRQVALKIIKAGMDSKQIIARFEAERQALSMMEHPNIANVLDVGTTENGRPFFVMELIKGLPVTHYCDEKRLSLIERLTLFKSICSAIQHAHQKGIIHRDLKPSNILVAEHDKRPVPKVIDFGLAKALHQPLTDRTMVTELGQVLGTLEYMSPEQARLTQLDIDTRADIYSLGVLLYELLTGTVPFDKKRLRSVALDQVLKIIREEEPPKPSTRFSFTDSSAEIASNRGIEAKRLEMLLRGDLDWIAMKAMEKDRNRRYESANGLAMDVERYIIGEPVFAAPPSAAYRLKKLLRRNRVAVITGCLAGAGLLLALVGTSIGMAWALREQKRASDAVIVATNAESQASENARLAQIARKNAETERLAAVYSRYVSNIPAAQSFLDDQSTSLARSILRSAPEEHRNFEWAYLANLAWPHFPESNQLDDLRKLPNLSVSDYWRNGIPDFFREIIPSSVSGGLNEGHFSSDGNAVFLTLANSVIKKHSVADGKLESSYPIPGGNIIFVAASPDGRKIAGLTFSSRPTVWSVDTGEMIANQDTEPEGITSPWICRWTPNQQYLVSTHMGGAVRIWDSATLELKAELMTDQGDKHYGDVHCLEFSRESNAMWSASRDGSIKKWSIPDGQLLGNSVIPLDREFEFQAISPSREWAVAVCKDGSSFLWRIEDEELVASLSGPALSPYVGAPRFAAEFSPDNSCVAVMTDSKSITVFDVAKRQAVANIEGNGYPLRSVHYSPDGTRLLTVSEDGRARIWSSFPKDQALLADAHGDVVFQIDIDSTSSTLLAGSYDTTASAWNLNTGKRMSMYPGHKSEIVAVDLHPNNRMAATLDASGNLHVWSVLDGTPQYQIDSQSTRFARHIGKAGGGIRSNLLNFPAVLSTGMFSPDGTRIVAYEKDSMYVFDALTGQKLHPLAGATDSAWPVYNSKSDLVAILEMNSRKIGVWDIQNGKLMHHLDGPREFLVMLDFSPVDDRLLACGMESGIVVWDGRTGERLHVIDVEQTGNVVSCRFSEDGHYILASYADSTARVWSARDYTLVTTLTGHSNRVVDTRLSPDQTRLLTWAMDNKVIIWDFAKPNANQLLEETSNPCRLTGLLTAEML